MHGQNHIKLSGDIITKVHISASKVPRCSCQILIKSEFSRQIFEKHSNVKFYEIAHSGRRGCEETQADGHTDMTKLIVALSDFANEPEERS